MRRFTKTFVENRWYRGGSSPGVFEEIPAAETQEGVPLDTQIKNWVAATGNVIIHPGQLGMHTSWHGDAANPYQLKCLTFGLTVLYQESSHGGPADPIQHADPNGLDPGAITTGPGTIATRPWCDT